MSITLNLPPDMEARVPLLTEELLVSRFAQAMG